MQSFEWRRPLSVMEAVAALRECADPKLISGGMSLIPTLKQNLSTPSDLVDLNCVPGVAGISLEGDRLVIGAMTRHVDVAESPLVRDKAPALAALALGIGDPCVRRRGTIGGSVANADPAADYPAAVLGFGGEVETSARRIAADDFFTGLFETALEPDEIVTAVRFRIPDRAHYVKFAHPASGYAVVGLMVARRGAEVRLAVTGAAANAFRVRAMEQALEQRFAPDAIASVKINPADMLGDMHCSAAFRAHLVEVIAKRTVAALV